MARNQLTNGITIIGSGDFLVEELRCSFATQTEAEMINAMWNEAKLHGVGIREITNLIGAILRMDGNTSSAWSGKQ